MAWGAKGSSGVSDLVKRLADNDARLEELHIMRVRKLDDAGVKDLCKALERNTVCNTLYASGHAMSTKGAGQVGAMLAINKTLRNLCVGDEDFGDEALLSLALGLGASCVLQKLDLENRGISGPGVQALCAVLESNTQLKTLNVSKNSLEPVGLSAFSGHHLHLEHLELRGCGMTGAGLEGSDDDLRWNMPTLQTLDLAANPLTPASARGLAVILRSCSHSLRRLSLSGTEVGDEGAAAVAAELAHLTALTHLDLSGCGITSIGAETLGSGLAALPAGSLVLSELLLTNNNLKAGDKPFSGLAAGLKQLPTLRFLELGNCSLAAPSVWQLAHITSLRSLSIFGNSMGNSLLEELGKAMGDRDEAGESRSRSFCSLQMLSLSGNELKKDALATFLAALQELPNKVLEWKELEIGANPGCEDPDLEASVTRCQAAIPQLKIVWRASDIQTSRILPAFPGKETDAEAQPLPTA